MPRLPVIVVTDGTVKLPELEKIATVLQWTGSEQMPYDQLVEVVKSADALFCLLRDRIDKALLDAAPDLRIICTMSAGFDHIDVDECRKRGIKVGYTPDVSTESVAELTLALTLATARRIVECARIIKSGPWGAWKPYWMCGKSVNGSVVGIFGMGCIGESFADKISALNPSEIIYCNRRPKAGSLYRFVHFEDLVRNSDILVIAAAPSSDNFRLFNKEVFSKMKSDAIIINVSRGTLVNTDDLYHALVGGCIAAAGLDVTDPEPLPLSHPLHSLENCVILPHIGSATFAARDAMAATTEENIFNALTGKQMVYRLV